jgi:DNA-directed RNA polymerase specialized sigma24 family protein
LLSSGALAWLRSRIPMDVLFVTTHWSVILGAKEEGRRLAALEALYKKYWRPVCFYLRRKGVGEGEVEDEAQNFFVHFFARALARADPERGRFRSFLLGVLERHFMEQRRQTRALKRGGGAEHVPLGLESAADAESGSPDLSAEFDGEWARTLFEEALRRFDAESEVSCGNLTPLEIRELIFNPGVAAAEWVGRCGGTVTAVKSRIFRLRRRFREILREEVSATVTAEEEVESELRHLCKALGTRWE